MVSSGNGITTNHNLGDTVYFVTTACTTCNNQGVVNIVDENFVCPKCLGGTKINSPEKAAISGSVHQILVNKTQVVCDVCYGVTYGLGMKVFPESKCFSSEAAALASIPRLKIPILPPAIALLKPS